MALDYYEVKANAKITWSLDILRRLPSGYHEIEGVMQEIDFADSIHLNSNPEGILTVTTTSPELPTDSRNLVWKATKEVQDYCGIKRGIHIHIIKRIPIGGGVGGGSSDAAAVIRGLNHMWQLGLGTNEMLCIAQRVSMDTCFSIIGGTALVHGRGELVSPVSIDRTLELVIANPGFPILTREAYAEIDLTRVGKMRHSTKMLNALENGDARTIGLCLHNDFEYSIMPRAPGLADIKRIMVYHGASGALLSGSGSSVFGIITSEANRMSLRDALSRYCSLVLITRTITRRKDEL